MAPFAFFEYFITMWLNAVWIGVRALRPGRQRRVQAVGVQRRALVGLELVGAVECGDVDRRAVERRADVAGKERAVVVAVVPGEAALVVRVLIELRHEAYRLDGFRRVEHHLAFGVDFLAAEGPQVRIGEGRRVAEGVAERLADRVLVAFSFLPTS
jgi:hypothetical protein